MHLKRLCYSAMISICYIFLTPFLGIHDPLCSTLPFDDESVFCSYFIISGDEPDEQDIEEFCFQSGRPAFTAFKPSEIFTKNSIRKEKARISKRIDELKEDPLFIWNIKGELSYRSRSRDYRVIINEIDLPEPTPYINSRISEEGSRALKRTLNSLVNKYSGFLNKKELDINVSLKPESVVYEFQKRNIADEDVVLPIRYIIFCPVKVELPDKRMTVEVDIP